MIRVPDNELHDLVDFMANQRESNTNHIFLFTLPADRTLTFNLDGLTDDGKPLARAALDAWSLVTGIAFEETSESDNANILFTSNPAKSPQAIHPDTNNKASVNIPPAHLEDYGTKLSNRPLKTFIHEIGHAIGLDHPGPYKTEEGKDRFTFPADSQHVSIMSYRLTDGRSYYNNEWLQGKNPNNLTYARPITPQIADIMAIQALYGLPEPDSHDTVYGTDSNTGTYLDNLFKLDLTGEYATGEPLALTLTLYDTGGYDTLDLSNDTENQQVNLNPVWASDVFGDTGTLIIARDTWIERYLAGQGDDDITGNAADNRLEGGPGNDTINGGPGNDILIGGPGRDTLTGGPGADVFVMPGNSEDTITDFNPDEGDLRVTDTGNLPAPIAYEPATTALTGTYGNDTLRGNSANNRIDGFDGDDALHGNAGADILHGGPGNDTAAYGQSPQGIVARLHTGAGLKGHAEGDTFHEIENLTGSSHDDTLAGDADDNILQGLAGNDTLYGGPGGNPDNSDNHDRLDGGDGNDKLYGGRGNDTLDGGPGQDRLNSGPGDDDLTGGPGADTFLFKPGHGHDTILDFNQADGDLIDLSGHDIKDYGNLDTAPGDRGIVISLNDSQDSITLAGINDINEDMFIA